MTPAGTFLAVLAALACAGALACLAIAARAWWHRRQDARAYDRAVALFNGRRRAKILAVGRVVPLVPGQRVAVGWAFACENVVPPFDIGPHGEPVFAGYTLRELDEIAARRSEFEG